MLFFVCFRLIFGRSTKTALRFDAVVASAMSVALLTLFVSFLTYEVDFLRWLATAAAYEVAVVSHGLFGIGNTFVTAWWIHCCLASFVGAFIFGVRKTSPGSQNLLLGSLLITILLYPAIYLQGSSHNHGYGIIAFAAFGTYVGSLLGTGFGLFIRRQFSFQAA